MPLTEKNNYGAYDDKETFQTEFCGGVGIRDSTDVTSGASPAFITITDEVSIGII